MLDIRDLAVFAGAALLLNLTPGPDTLYVASHAAARGARTGAVAALGIGAGCLVHVLAAALGLSALLVASQGAFAVLQLLGAGYLVWVGLGLLRAPTPAVPASEAATSAAAPATSPGRVFWGAALTNALNPKVALFFLAFLPQFVAPDGQRRAASFLVLGLLFDLSGTAWLLLVAAFTARATRRAGSTGRIARGLGRVTGALFVLLGLRLALARP